jgi:polyvinyl alcohol dehydrogenase (cytochrome)
LKPLGRSFLFRPLVGAHFEHRHLAPIRVSDYDSPHPRPCSPGEQPMTKTRVLAMVFPVLLIGPAAHAQQEKADAAALFARNCASCHTGAADSRAPSPDALKDRAPESIIDALTGGAMRYQGLSLSGSERRAIAEYLTGRPAGAGTPVDLNAGRCANPAPMSASASAPQWNGWGPGLRNTHVVPASVAGLTGEDLPKLTLKWAIGFPEATSAWAQPTIVGGRLFVGSQNGTVYALDAKSGCVIWTFVAEGGVRAAISIGRHGSGGYGAYFSDQKGFAYAVDASTGKQIWRRKVEDHPLIRLTGSPVLHDGRLYVPTSSYEEVGKGPDYACCTFRGSIVALDAATGTQIWKSYVITETPKVLGKNQAGVDSIGPSGGAIWSAPTIDVRRGVIYAATGNTYSGKSSQPGTDGVIALDLKTGKTRWTKQLAPDDVYGCRNGEPNCGDKQGPDFDFGGSPALTRRADGRDLLIVGQKSGVGFALDPDKGGEIVWEYRAGRGGALGGIEWGVAADGRLAYFPVADLTTPQPGGLHAVDLQTGQRSWFAPPVQPLLCGRGRGCNAAQSAAVTVIPGAVFSGAFDGGIRAYSTRDGAVIWQFDTNREFLTVNRVRARGASLNGPAPVVVGGMVYVSSGDYRGRPGNVLVAFGID